MSYRIPSVIWYDNEKHIEQTISQKGVAQWELSLVSQKCVNAFQHLNAIQNAIRQYLRRSIIVLFETI
jgi:diketogulonate reductase-like aldo/keto reductase